MAVQEGGIHPPIDADPGAREGTIIGEGVGQEVPHPTGEGGAAKRAAAAVNQKCESDDNSNSTLKSTTKNLKLLETHLHKTF